MTTEGAHVERNREELTRMRQIVERASDDDLRRPVNPDWTVAGVLAHIAFWDVRTSFLCRKLQGGEPFSESEYEPEDVDWINDSSRPLIHAIDPRRAAQVALELAEETDALVASLSADRMYPGDPESPINAFRSDHRGEHLDDIEAALALDRDTGLDS